MDVCYGKQAPRKGSVTSDSQDGAAQFCNRLGCCGRLHHTKAMKNKCLEKSKPSNPSFRSSSSKEVTGSCSKNFSSVTKLPLLESRKKPSFKIETIPTESSSVSSSSARSLTERKSKSSNTELKKAVLMPVSKTTVDPSSSMRIRRGYGVVNQASESGSDHGFLGSSNQSRDFSKTESKNGWRMNEVKKRFTRGESSSVRKGKSVSGLAPNEGCVSDPRHSRNWTACRPSGGSSVRTRRSANVDLSTEPVNRLRQENVPFLQSTNVIPDTPQIEILWPDSSSSDTSSTMISVNSTDDAIVRFMNHSGTRHYNIDGIADVLLALDRIEQNEGLTYEQLLSLEANLFLGGLNFYDQHRDMRLDIDNMSYEELLVLEEKIGTVSTALSKEELLKCIRISTYETLQLEDGRTRCSLDSDDNKCSICQEEFLKGDEIGRVGCGHGYHALCIKEWLGFKNWCPICKAETKL